MSSTMTASKPRFARFECRALPLPPSSVCGLAGASPSGDRSGSERATTFRQEMPAVFGALRRITSALDRSKVSQPASAIAVFAFNKVRSTVEHQLLSLPASPQEALAPPTPHDAHVDEAARVASLIYINYVLRDINISIALLRVLKRKLMDECEQHGASAAEVTDEAALRLLLWSVCMGALLAADEREDDWFAERVARAMMRTGLGSWAEVEACLRRFLWVKKMSDSLRGGFWLKVEEQLERLRRG